MKSKTPLTLMELLVMLLIFSIAAALCVQIFVTSDRWARENELQDRAILSAQNAAELLKLSGGNLEAASNLLGGTVSDETWMLLFDEEGQLVAQTDEAVYDIIVEKTNSGQDLLGTAAVTARTVPESEELFRITAAWQEVERNE